MSDTFTTEQMQRDTARVHHVWSALVNGCTPEERAGVHDLYSSQVGTMMFFMDEEGHAKALSEDTGVVITVDDLSTFVAYKNDDDYADQMEDFCVLIELPVTPTTFQTSDEVFEFFFGGTE